MMSSYGMSPKYSRLRSGCVSPQLLECSRFIPRKGRCGIRLGCRRRGGGTGTSTSMAVRGYPPPYTRRKGAHVIRYTNSTRERGQNRWKCDRLYHTSLIT